MTPLLPMCLGGAGAAVAVSVLYHRSPSRWMVIVANSVVCALLAALTAYPTSASPLTPLAAGFLSTAAPVTSVFLPRPAIETVSEAIRFAGRVGGLLALNMLYGVTFATAGFLTALAFTTAPPH